MRGLWPLVACRGKYVTHARDLSSTRTLHPTLVADGHHIMPVLLLAASLSMVQTPAAAAVASWMSGQNLALPRTALRTDVKFHSDLCQFSGAEEYCCNTARWQRDSTELLSEFETSILRVAATGESEVVVRWRAEWAPDQNRWLATFAEAVGWKVSRFDLDPSAVSSFSWRAVGKLLSSAASTGQLRLPCSSVEGTSRLRLEPRRSPDAESSAGDEDQQFVVSSIRDAIDHVSAADAGTLLNRKCAADVAMFLDMRRPSAVDPDEWAATVRSRVLVGVPGAGTLDIEPMDDEREGSVALAAFAVLMLGAVIAALVTGLGGQVSTVNSDFGASLCDEVAASYYGQCVNDLYS